MNVLKINNMNFLTLNTCKAYGLSDLRIKTTSGGKNEKN